MKKIFLFALIFFSAQAYAQYKIVTPQSKVTISGTSSMHDWTSVCEEVTGKGDFVIEGGEIKGLNGATISMKAEDIKSGKSLMDSKTYDAFDYENTPYIKGVWTSMTSLNKKGTSYELKGKGTLEMKGKKLPVNYSFTCSISGSKIKCKGKQNVDMTKHGVKPPTAMMGTIKVGDEVELEMEFEFSK